MQETPVSTLHKNIQWGVVVPTMVYTHVVLYRKNDMTLIFFLTVSEKNFH